MSTNELFANISALIDYREEDWTILREEAGQIRAWIPELVDAFYNTLYGNPDTASVFLEGERPKLEKTLETWVMTLTAGNQGTAFWDHQYFIGLRHVERNIKNLYLLGMMNRIQQIVLAKCMATYDKDKALRVYGAFLRLSGTIAALIAECYGVVIDRSISEGLARVGMNTALLGRIKDMQIKKMLQEVGH